MLIILQLLYRGSEMATQVYLHLGGSGRLCCGLLSSDTHPSTQKSKNLYRLLGRPRRMERVQAIDD